MSMIVACPYCGERFEASPNPDYWTPSFLFRCPCCRKLVDASDGGLRWSRRSPALPPSFTPV